MVFGVEMKRRCSFEVSVSTVAALCLFLSGCGEREIPKEILTAYSTAREAYAAGYLSKAEKVCSEILSRAKGFDQARMLLAKSLFFQDRAAEAEEQVRALLEKRPDYREADVLLIRLLLKTDRAAEARARIDNLLSVDPADPRLLYLRSLAAMEQEDLPMALACLKEASLFSDEYAQVFLDLAGLYYVNRLEGPAVRELEKALSLLSSESLLRRPVEELMDKIVETTASGAEGGL